MKFDRTNNRKNESLMGWTATEDPTGILRLTFPDSDAAIAFAQRNGTTLAVLPPSIWVKFIIQDPP
jgi:hypothetical protein